MSSKYLVTKMGIKPISFLVANLVAQLIAMLVAQCERTLRPKSVTNVTTHITQWSFFETRLTAIA